MITCLICTFFQGNSAAQAIAADDLVKQCPSRVPEAVCQPNPARMQQQIEKGAVSSTRGEGTISGKKVMRLYGMKNNIQSYSSVLLFFFLELYEVKYRYVTLHVNRRLTQISCYGYFHGPGHKIVKNYWNVSEISLLHREKFTATVKYFTP